MSCNRTATTADALENAADHLLVHGRYRHDLVDPDNPDVGCVINALFESNGRDFQVLRPAQRVLDEHVQSLGYFDQVSWNSEVEDDFEVIDTLRHLAKDIRNEVSA